MEGVPEVGPVPRGLPLDVGDEAAKKLPGSFQRDVLVRMFCKP